MWKGVWGGVGEVDEGKVEETIRRIMTGQRRKGWRGKACYLLRPII